MKLQLKPDVLVGEDAEGKKTLTLSEKCYHLGKFSFSLDPILRSLKEGIEEETLEDLVEEGKIGHLFYLLELLKKKALLLYRTQCITLAPFNAQYQLDAPLQDGKYRLSRFVVCRLEGDQMILETPLAPVQVTIQAGEGITLFYAFREPLSLTDLQKRFPDLSFNELKETCALLASAGILTAGEESTASSQWEFHDLLFHSRTRLGRQEAPYGGTYRFKGKIPPLPAVKKYPTHRKIPLSIPQIQGDPSFDAVIQKRKSIRQYGPKPVTLEQLGEFLYRSSRVKEMHNTDNQEYTSRPYPGGGARYELELYPIIHKCEGIAAGMYHYDPEAHLFSEIAPWGEDVEAFLKGASLHSGKEEYPQVLIAISARFQRVSWKYQSMAYAVILKNVGVLYQTMYLTATAMNLAPCALGGGNSDHFCRVTGTDYLEETSVGEFMLGSLP